MPSLFDKKEIMKLFGASSYLETNTSELFFTEQFVYKIKRPVNLGFVDFTKQEERNRVDKAEFEINKIISPNIYLELILLGNDGNGQLITGALAGRAIEYVLKMARFPANSCLTSLLSQKSIDKKLTLKLAEALVNCHKKLESGGSFLEYGAPKVIEGNLENVFNLIRGDFNKMILNDEEFKKMVSGSRIVLRNSVLYFEKRLSENTIQLIHGDLHSENVFVKDGAPFITDAILPIPAWQHGDRAVDIGALAMDFDAYGLNALANVLANEYAKKKNDGSIQEVIPFYKLSWALIRFWVNLHAYKQGRKETEQKAKMYKNLIFRYLSPTK